MKKSSIRSKIVAVFVAVSVASLIASGLLSIYQLREIRDITEDSLITMSRKDLQSLANEKAKSIDSRIQSYVDNLDIMTSYASDYYLNPQQHLPKPVPYYLDMPEGVLGLHYFPEPWVREAGVDMDALMEETDLLGNIDTMFAAFMTQHPEITTMCIATESGQNLQFDDHALNKVGAVQGGFSSHARPWYTSAKDSGDLVISDSYRDAAGRGLAITISAPILAAGEIMGVMCFDIRIDDLDEQLRKEIIGENGYIELMGGDKVISSPTLTLENEYDLPGYYDIMGNQYSGTAVSGNQYIAWSRIPLTGWRVVLLMPESEILAPVEQADAQIYQAIISTAALLMLIVLITIYIAFVAARRVAEPLRSLAADAEKIGRGEDIQLSVQTGDEVELLAETINEMLVNIKTVTGEKERIGAELNVATKIQASMLPSIFPAFPERSEFDLYAVMMPAKEVGGDFYDFFHIDEETLAVVIADVSGKGVPAALFMVIAKTLLKSNAQHMKSPKAVIETVNNLLCEGNDEGMFVTVLLGYFHIPSGSFTFVNAGHNPPLIKRADQDFDWLKVKPGLFLAGMEDVEYTQHEIILAPGDELFLYTDGVTEAVNKEFLLFSEEHLLSVANNNQGLQLGQFTKAVKDEIDAFANGAEQADDITMLALRYTGKSGDKEE